jgi:hypothetical protein
MGRANVYLPDDLERRVKAAGIPISEVCQRALLAAVEAVETDDHQPLGQEVSVQFRRGWDAGGDWAGSAPSGLLLTLLRDQRLAEVPREALADDLYSLTEEQTLAWEAGFMEAARAAVRAALPANPPLGRRDGALLADAAPQGPSDSVSAAQSESASEPASESASESESESAEATGAAGLGDDSGCYIGVTLDGDRVAFDPHAAVRAGKSPLFAILGHPDLRARLTLSVAQDAASRGTAVVLVDLSGQLTARAAGAGKNVRVIRRTQAAMPQLDDLLTGAIGLGGLWDTLSHLSSSSGLSAMFGSPDDHVIEPGYVTVLSLFGDGALTTALSLAQAATALTRLATPADYPRLLQVDLPPGLTIPTPLAARLDRIIRTAREHDAAVGISAESAETLSKVGASGALLSTVFAFATNNPVEADRLRGLLGAHAPVLLNPPGTTTTPGDETWAVLRDLNGRLGQVRIDAS